MRTVLSVVGACVLGACALGGDPNPAHEWTPAKSGGVCSAYINAPPSHGSLAWIRAAPTRQIRGTWGAGVLQAGCADARGGVLWRLEGTEKGEGLGWSVAGLQDINDDGWGEVAVGTPHAGRAEDHQRGSVRLLSGRSGAMIWRTDGEAEFDQLGVCVARLADWDGDGVVEVLTCAAGEGSNEPRGSGTVVVLSGRTGARIWQREISTESDGPGRSACASDDLDGDGREDIVFGVSSGRATGCVHVLGSRSGEVIWRVDGRADGSALGEQVARTCDFDGDGVRDVLATAPWEGEGGELYLLSGADGSSLKTLHGRAGEYLGRFLYEVPDCDGDGIPEVGVSFDTDNAPRVRVFYGGSLTVMGEFPFSRVP